MSIRLAVVSALAVGLIGVGVAGDRAADNPVLEPSAKSRTVTPQIVSGSVSEGLALPKEHSAFRSEESRSVQEDPHLNKIPPREIRHLELFRLRWKYNCMECHKLIESEWHFERPLAEHQEIRLNHGNNRFCLNCHHPKNRQAYVDDDGSEIQESEVVLLCARCHGPTHRDWKAGVHGRRNGYWDVRRGERSQLGCIQCHDPHEPKFKAIPPLAPPRYPERAAHSPELNESTEITRNVGGDSIGHVGSESRGKP